MKALNCVRGPSTFNDLRKAIMKRTRLKRIANIAHSDENIRKYKRQRNLVVKMNKQAKIEFYKNLDPKKLDSESVLANVQAFIVQ